MQDGFIKVAAATPRVRLADPEKNAEAIIDLLLRAASGGARVVVFPELCVTGYTCGDLFFQRTLTDKAQAALARIAEASRGLDTLCFVGLPVGVGGRLYNCAAVVYNGAVLALVPKTNLPNYGEFYEKRHFTPAPEETEIAVLGELGEVPIGTRLLFRHVSEPDLCVACEICEDLWVPFPPSAEHAVAGATIIVNLSASDETVTKSEYRRTLVSSQSARLVSGYIYADAGLGESTTDVVFTGHDLIAENGALLAERETLSGMVMSEIDVHRLVSERRRVGEFDGSGSGYTVIGWGGACAETPLTRSFSRTPFVPEEAEMRALRCRKILMLQSLGLRSRMERAGVHHVIVGVSGGLDSTLALLVAAQAVRELGLPEKHLIAVTMPCFGTTARTKSNAVRLSERLGADLRVVDIGEAVKRHFADIGHDAGNRNVVFENAQARERTQVLMDIANACGGLVVGTGDMSELALGWATYNGDHMSMYGVNAGIPKTLVRHLVAFLADTTSDGALAGVLRDILATPVSPELLPAENGEISQKTEDLVGPYALHDFFLYYLVRWGFPPKKVLRMACLAFAGEYDAQTIRKWLHTFVRRFFQQQFKRSCLPDGPKVGTLSLSPRGDWRMPSDAVSDAWLAEIKE